ncbi:MAG: TonB-dependent receptor [Flavobacteriaceae bacterium]|jgi:hypothetical protein|nr:TonB-dependent receptor [Flavobacteriaceae bacterium]
MKKTFVSAVFFLGTFTFAQEKESDTAEKSKDIEEVVLVARKPTVETKVDRTVFNVANSSILAGNNTWDVLRMTPLVSIDNNDAVKAEGENVTVYINDRKSVFTGKELKEYLKTIPAENLMKIEVITNPSARYETSGAVINIVLKKPDNEGIKGSASFTNRQGYKNSQYTNLNLNYHKNKFTQTFSGSYDDGTYINRSSNENLLYADNSLTKINTETTYLNKTPSVSTTSEFELNDKNNIGAIFEFYQSNSDSFSDAFGENYLDDVLLNSYTQNLTSDGFFRNLGGNLFYKFYDKQKNKILDINLGLNYDSSPGNADYIMNIDNSANPSGARITNRDENREYYLKVDYSQPLEKIEGQLEFGGKADFRNNVMPNDYFNLVDNQWINDLDRSNNFHYSDNLNSLYINFSKTFFKKLESRIGLRYEHISYKIKQDVGNIEKTDSYGTLLPDLLLKYSFSDNYDLTGSYKHNIWRPWFSEFNPFLMTEDNGTYSRGNMDLQPNPSDRLNLKFGIHKKYFVSLSYWFTNHDYWNSYYVENGKTISMPTNFDGRVESYSLNFNTNQTFLKNKLSVNLNFWINYTDNSDFNRKNNLDVKNYLTNVNANTNISYTNLFNKNINFNAWVGIYTQNHGNTQANKTQVFHTISATKIFPVLQMEASVRLDNIFLKPGFDGTTFTPIGTFRSSQTWDWYGISLTLVKRFGNQNVKENTKTNVEKESGGGK